MSKIILMTTEKKGWIAENFERAAKELKHELEIIDPNDCYIVVSNDEQYISYNGTKFMGGDICIPRLSEHDLEYKSAIISTMQSMGIFVLNESPGLVKAQSKLDSQIEIIKSGFKAPKTCMLTDDSQLDYVVKYMDEKFPMIVKTLSGTHGIGVLIVESERSFKSIVQMLLKEDVKFLVQEFIEHEESKRIIVLGDKVLASNTRSANKGDFRTNSHQGSKTDAFEPSEKETEICVSLAKVFGLRFCAIDYIEVGDDIIILEVNGSPGLEKIQENFKDRDLTKEVIEYCAASIKPESDEVKPDEPKSDDKTPSDPEPFGQLITLNSGVIIHTIDSELLAAKIDTGAGLCSLGAKNIDVDEEMMKLKFDFNDKTFTVGIDRFVIIKNSLGSARRPVVKFDIEINNQNYENVDFTVVDRSHLSYKVLIGRKFLQEYNFQIDMASNETEEE